MKIYTHKLTGIRLTIKKLFGSVASCRLVDKTIKMPYSNLTTDTIVCSLNNLEEITKTNRKMRDEFKDDNDEETPVLDIALDIVFLKYGNDCFQDAKFNTDLGEAYDFIQNFIT